MIVTEPDVGADHVTAIEPEVRADEVTPAKPEEVRPSPCWIPAGVILALGLMSLMGTACVGLGISPVWRDGVTCPSVVCHLTPANPEA